MTAQPVLTYNVERLFRPGGGSIARALNATARNGWTEEVYERKIEAVGAVMADATGGQRPAVVVLVEVEDQVVVDDLMAAAGWPEMVNVAVPDEQVDGYDVAIAYDPARFTAVSDSRSYNFNGRFSTRDLMVARLELEDDQELVVCGTHWASRRMIEGTPLRYAAASYCSQIVENILKFPKEDVIDASGNPTLPTREAMLDRWMTPVMFSGDLNDGPWDTTVRTLVDSTPDLDRVQALPLLPQNTDLSAAASYLSRRPRLYNPTWYLLRGTGPIGTYVFNGEWDPLDQILVSAGLLADEGPRFVQGSLRAHGPRTVESSSGDEIFVTTRDYGRPISFNTSSGRGVSDHLPLVGTLEFD